MHLTDIATSTREAILTSDFWMDPKQPYPANDSHCFDFGPHNQDAEVLFHIASGMGRDYWIQHWSYGALANSEAMKRILERFMDVQCMFASMFNCADMVDFLEEPLRRLHDSPQFWMPLCEIFFKKLHAIVEFEVERGALNDPYPGMFTIETGYERIQQCMAPNTAVALRPYFVEQFGQVMLKLNPGIARDPMKYRELEDEGLLIGVEPYGDSNEKQMLDEFMESFFAHQERDDLAKVAPATQKTKRAASL